MAKVEVTVPLMSWRHRDELKPYPWATVPCPTCGETELASSPSVRPWTGYVCMACGWTGVIALIVTTDGVTAQPIDITQLRAR